MLIRSQDKERIMDFARASVGIDHEVSEDNDIWISIVYSENACGLLGKYSSKEKAIKVLNMIQEAYKNNEKLRTLLTGYTSAIAINPDTVDFETSTVIEKVLRESYVFQMP